MTLYNHTDGTQSWSHKIITSYLPSVRAILENLGLRSWQYTKCSKVHTKMTKGQYCPIQLEQAIWVSGETEN